MQNPACGGRIRTPLEKQRDFADAQPAAYGFEVRTSEFPNPLKLLQAIEIVKFNFPHFF
jgi:hypothetical protein